MEAVGAKRSVPTIILTLLITISLSLSVLLTGSGCTQEEPVEEVIQPDPIYTSTYEEFGAIFVQQCDEEEGSLVTKESKDEEGKTINVPQTVNLGTSQTSLIPVSAQAPAARGGIIRVNSEVDTTTDTTTESEADTSDTPKMDEKGLLEELNNIFSTDLELDSTLEKQSKNRPKELKQLFATNKLWNYGGSLVEIPLMGVTLEEIPDAIQATGYEDYFKAGYTHIAIVYDEDTKYGSIILWAPTEEYPKPPSEQTALTEPVTSAPLVESVLIDVVQVTDAEIPGIGFLDESVVVLEDTESIEVDSDTAQIGFSLADSAGNPIGTSIYSPNKEGYAWSYFVTAVSGLNIMTALPKSISGSPIVEVKQSAIDDIITTLTNLKDAGNLAAAAAMADAILEILGANDATYTAVITAVTDTRAQIQVAIDEADAAAAAEAERIAAEEAAARQAAEAAQQQQYYNPGYGGGYVDNGGGYVDNTVFLPCWICTDCGSIFISWDDDATVDWHRSQGHIVGKSLAPVG